MATIDTNINNIASEYPADIVQYSDDNLQSIISNLSTIESKLDDLSAQISGYGNSDESWEGEAKEAYNEYKKFLEDYGSAYKTSITDLKNAVTGLATLLSSIPDANVMKDVEEQ